MIKKIGAFWELLNKRRYSTLAGTLSFFFLLSFVPMIFLAFYVFNIFAFDFEAIPFIANLDFLDFDFSSPVSILFIGTTLFSSSGLFYHLRRVGELIYNTKKTKSGWGIRLASILSLLFFLGIIVAGMLFIVTANHFIPDNASEIIGSTITFILLICIAFFALLVINQHASPHSRKLLRYTKGTIFSLVLIIISTAGFLLYLKYFANYDFLYGYLASLIIIFLWIYLVMMSVIIGIVVNSEHLR